MLTRLEVGRWVSRIYRELVESTPTPSRLSAPIPEIDMNCRPTRLLIVLHDPREVPAKPVEHRSGVKRPLIPVLSPQDWLVSCRLDACHHSLAYFLRATAALDHIDGYVNRHRKASPLSISSMLHIADASRSNIAPRSPRNLSSKS